MPNVDGSWAAIVPRRRARRARMIAVRHLRGDVEHLATEKGFPPDSLDLVLVARKRETPQKGVDQAAEIRDLTRWARWGSP
jgi:hypothetical protein